MSKKDKKFPKIYKHLKNYLTDESGKITKHNALGLGAVGAVLGGFEAVEGHHHNNGGYYAGNLNRSFSPNNPSPGDNQRFYSSPSCAHSSGIHNGTYSDVINANAGGYYAQHSSGGGSSWSTNTPYSGNRTFYLDCGSVNQAINGHYSSTGSLGASRETVSHTSTHTNY